MILLLSSYAGPRHLVNILPRLATGGKEDEMYRVFFFVIHDIGWLIVI